MTNEAFVAFIQDLVRKYGRANVLRSLVIEGVSPTFASLVVRNKYKAEPRLVFVVAARRAAEALRANAA